MDEWEHYEADAFNFYDDVSVFFYSGYGAFISFEWSSDYSDWLPLFEVFFCEDFASGGVLSREEPQEANGFGRDFLDSVVVRITVYPKWDGPFGLASAVEFELERFFSGGFDKQNPWNDGSGATLFTG